MDIPGQEAVGNLIATWEGSRENLAFGNGVGRARVQANKEGTTVGLLLRANDELGTDSGFYASFRAILQPRNIWAEGFPLLQGRQETTYQASEVAWYDQSRDLFAYDREDGAFLLSPSSPAMRFRLHCPERFRGQPEPAGRIHITSQLLSRLPLEQTY